MGGWNMGDDTVTVLEQHGEGYSATVSGTSLSIRSRRYIMVMDGILGVWK
jgi:hypothetical protein